jgi:hypothetical protein
MKEHQDKVATQQLQKNSQGLRSRALFQKKSFVISYLYIFTINKAFRHTPRDSFDVRAVRCGFRLCCYVDPSHHYPTSATVAAYTVALCGRT